MRDEMFDPRICEWAREIKKYSRGRKLSPKDSALLVMDMQEFFLNPESHAYIPAGRKIIQNIVNLVSEFRRQRLPIIFTRHAIKDEEPGMMKIWWKDILKEGDPLSNIIQELAPAKNDVVIRKTQYDAFYKTHLEKILHNAGVRQIVLCGVMTDLCCESTARSAFVRGFEVFFLADGTATINEQLHISALRTLAHGFAEVVTCRDIVRLLQYAGGEGAGAKEE